MPLTELEFEENRNDLAGTEDEGEVEEEEEERVGGAIERAVGVAGGRAPKDEAEELPGMERTEAVSVSVETRSSSLRADCPTGVKALVSLFWRCRVRGNVGRRGMMGVTSWLTCCGGAGGRVWEEREVGVGSLAGAEVREEEEEEAPCMALWRGESR